MAGAGRGLDMFSTSRAPLTLEDFPVRPAPTPRHLPMISTRAAAEKKFRAANHRDPFDSHASMARISASRVT
jgi:hypothetical protein